MYLSYSVRWGSLCKQWWFHESRVKLIQYNESISCTKRCSIVWMFRWVQEIRLKSTELWFYYVFLLSPTVLGLHKYADTKISNVYILCFWKENVTLSWMEGQNIFFDLLFSCVKVFKKHDTQFKLWAQYFVISTCSQSISFCVCIYVKFRFYNFFYIS